MTESLLPYAPLTHTELNARVREATEDAGYSVRALYRVHGSIPDHHVPELFKHAARAEEYAAAARARMPERYRSH